MPDDMPTIYRDRLRLQNILEEIFSIFHEADGRQHVFYQPDNNTKLYYPCVTYKMDRLDYIDADNSKYVTNVAYMLTIIDPDPISSCIDVEKTKTIIDAISELPKCSYVRHFVNDNLNHDVFKIYYK